SSNQWYVDGDNTKGESDKANKQFFDTDKNFNIVEFMHFANRMLIKEPKETGKAPAMIVFSSFQQMPMVAAYGEKYGFKHSFPMVFVKDTSPQVLKANMKVVGATEYATVLYRDKLPKFNNNGEMIFNWMRWGRDGKEIPKVYPTQKPQGVLERLIEIFTDRGDVVIDPVAGSGSTLRAAASLGREAYGFEIKKDFYKAAKEKMLLDIQPSLF
ncbi:adenine-specific DNA methyltransferase, partial [Weissella oryzae SG25]